MHVLEKHCADIQNIQQKFLRIQNKQQCSLCNPLHPSNLTRASQYKSQGSTLDINALNRILIIDPVEQIVITQPRVTMQQLIKATLKYGMMVPVIPEFKGITVGGAIMGTGLESASHRYGLFSDSCLAYEILLGNGRIIKASPQEHPDLFYAVVGSYGSLGIILSITLKLMPVQPWIKLKYYTFDRIADAVDHLQRFSHLETGPDFLEGFVFSKNHIAVVEGHYLSIEESQDVAHAFSQRYPWSPWFYQHVKEITRKEDEQEEKMPLFDYLFRHDRGAFWIGSYGTEWSALPRYFLESRWKLPKLAKLFPTKREEFGPKDPGYVYRCLLGWAMTSHRLYTWLHAHSEKWVSQRCIIQDFFIPAENAVSFIEAVYEETHIIPLWLCPISSVKKGQIFSPHLHAKSPLLINVGIYGIPSLPYKPSERITRLEQRTQAMQGRKMLYSHSYYTQEQFWDIYPKDAYDRLRRIYHADIWTDIDKKVL